MMNIGSTIAAAVQTPTVAKPIISAKPQATAATGEASGNQLFKNAPEMVEFAENFLDKLTSSLGLAEGLRRSLTPEQFERDKRIHGEETAKLRRAADEELMHKAEQMAQTDAAALRGAFSVSGDLIKTDEAGNRTLGRFALSGQGNGFAVRIDSEKGAFVSSGDGPFTSDFARITPPQLRNLPYLKAIADSLNVKV
ncbi:hypothetical protein [Azospirillum sp.]|uniref:hypothetical protein n=1 Tax=Azospirillum sp. TaxID=34012 RepID=UPI003D71C0A0